MFWLPLTSTPSGGLGRVIGVFLFSGVLLVTPGPCAAAHAGRSDSCVSFGVA